MSNMAASKNNQWWKLRAKHGRDKIFSSPETLWESCIEYFEVTDGRKWKKVEYKSTSKGLRKVEIPTETPYTISGLCIFLGIGTSTWNDYKTKPDYKDFSEVISMVEQIIYVQKFEGASVNAFNANIISRELGLADKQEIKTEYDGVDAIEFKVVYGKNNN